MGALQRPLLLRMLRPSPAAPAESVVAVPDSQMERRVSRIHQKARPFQLIADIPEAQIAVACRLSHRLLCQVEILPVYGKEIAAGNISGQLLPARETKLGISLPYQQAAPLHGNHRILRAANLVRQVLIAEFIGRNILYHKPLSLSSSFHAPFIVRLLLPLIKINFPSKGFLPGCDE